MAIQTFILADSHASKMCYVWSHFCKETLEVIKISKLFFDFVIRCSLCVRKVSMFRITADLMES